MKKYLFILFILFTSETLAETKKKIIQNLKNINNISFDFEQNINDKIEYGSCIVEYEKKIYCNYTSKNNKILVSNGKSLVIKTVNTGSYYRYPLNKTPLVFLLDKKYLISKMNILKPREINGKYLNFTFVENDNEINIFFNKKNYDLIGWQTLDIYQNLSITFLSSVLKNQYINKNLFILPKQN